MIDAIPMEEGVVNWVDFNEHASEGNRGEEGM